MSAIWAIPRPSQILFEEIDGYLACYSFLTGETHILDAFPAGIINSLAAHPKTSAQISLELAPQMAVDSNELVAQIEKVLRELQGIRLIDSRSS